MARTRSVTSRAAPGPRSPRHSPRKTKPLKSKTKKNPTKKIPKSRPLTSFHLFEKLPVELRAMIWNLTCVPRTVEVAFTQERGLYTRTITPIALRACPDSRSAVLHVYQACFGNFLQPARIWFNFSIDTLYFNQNLDNEIMLLFASLQSHEAKQLRHIAISEDINQDENYVDENRTDAFALVKKVVPMLPALKSIQLVCKMANRLDDVDDDLDGALRLYEAWPESVMKDHMEIMVEELITCACGQCYLDAFDPNVDDCPCGDHNLMDAKYVLGDVGNKNVKLSSIWGWRPPAGVRTTQF